MGAVLLGSFRTLSIACTNTGDYIDGIGAGDPLLIQSITSDRDEFEVKIVEIDGAPGPKADGYLAGEGFQVEVTFRPVDEGAVLGLVHLKSPAVGSGSLALEVRGRGQEVGSCTHSDVRSYPPEGEAGGWLGLLLRETPLDRNGDGKVDEADIEMSLEGESMAHSFGESKAWTFEVEQNTIYFSPPFVPYGLSAAATYDHPCR